MINFNSLKIRFLNDKDILSLSYGEVRKPETINYRTLLPETGGLFCQKIFGPIVDYCCLCNLGPRPELLGSVCNTCGVSILDSFSRRSRIGHISLNTPLLHIWMLKSIPSNISVILNKSSKYIEDIVYYRKFVVISSESELVKPGELISVNTYYSKILVFGSTLKVGIGASAIKDLLSKIDLTKEILQMESNLYKCNIYNRDRLYLRYSIFKKFRDEGIVLTSLILNNIPVLPADLRPLINLGDNRFISSDVNELYKRLICRNNRLRKLIKINAPDFIIMNEKRLLQESFDCLLDNGRKIKSYKLNNRLLLKSLSESVKGKYGRFRQNLLGKRVDYSGRAVIVVNPRLRLNYCNLPYQIALELFRPFIFKYLVGSKITNSFIESRDFLDRNSKHLLTILKKVTRNHPIILNRAPTLHRLNIQSFYPIITRDKSIKIHPLICTAYNADFDGDQMSVHLPLSYESIKESKSLLLSTNNIFLPSNSLLSLVLSQEIVLGLNYLTRLLPCTSNILYFYCCSDVINSYYSGTVSLNKEIFFMHKENFFIRTTVGRMFLYNLLPNKDFFLLINTTLDKPKVNYFINYISSYIKNSKVLTKLISKIMKLGFYFSTKSGLSISVFDINIVDSKKILLSFLNRRILQNSSFVVTKKRNFEKFDDISFYIKLSNLINNYSKLLNKFSRIYFNSNQYRFNFRNNLSNIIESGSKGTYSQLFQISGIRGLVMKSSNELLNFPIFSNLKQGMDSDEYYISTFGARKGLSDTSLKTSESGYLTRRLVDVSQNIIINSFDCNTNRGLFVNYNDKYIYCYIGRSLLSNLFLNTGKLLFPSNKIITSTDIEFIVSKKLYFFVRTPVFCLLKSGVCSRCYGIDLSTRYIISEGNCIGITSAQSISEPGTQLTMRTFHTGGMMSSLTNDINIFDYIRGFVKLTSNIYTFNSNYNSNFLVNSGNINFLDFYSNILYYNNIYTSNYLNYTNNRYYNNIRLNSLFFNYKYCPFNSHYKLYNFDKCNKLLLYTCRYYNIFYIRSIKPNIAVFIKLLGLNTNCILNIRKDDFLIIPISNIIRQGFIVKFSSSYLSTYFDITSSLGEISDLLEVRKCGKLSTINKNLLPYNKTSLFLSSKLVFFYTTIYITNVLGPTLNLIPKGSIINSIYPNTYIYISPISILETYGIYYFTKYFIYKLRSIYLTYGVILDIKNFEIILRSIISYILLFKSPGININLKKTKRFLYNNSKYIYKNILTGITRVSLGSDSFISASSFQDTIKILVNSAIKFKIDRLKGIKENVIIGSIIPAGTGFFLRKL
ncbi:DNA-directed RNA polymerase subunit beta' [Candidatus Vidania fulgoroideorum]